MKLKLVAIASVLALCAAGAAAADSGHAKTVKAHVTQAEQSSHVGAASLFDAAVAYLGSTSRRSSRT